MTKTNRLLRKLFPKAMRQQYFIGHRKGRNYGVNLALMVLHEELRATHKNLDVPLLSVDARIKAKHIQTLIRKVKTLNAK
jgi:hypothetical protein